MAYSQRIQREDVRRDDRFPTLFAARIKVCGQSYLVSILNISCRGCLIAGETLPGVGSLLAVQAAGLDVAGRVMWRAAARAGILFSATINPLAAVRDNLPRFRAIRRELGKPVPPNVV